MTLKHGTTLANYVILAPLGAGGMGEVYRARDTRLGREVAIKVLSEQFGQSNESVARFEREAKVLASLDHPNIAAIYGFEHANDTRFLVLQLVEGETLAERLKRGPMPPIEALEVFRQMAEGLEAAHEKGVVHRDLKPANVKITPEGKVKVLDFGIAKGLLDAPSGNENAVSDDTPTLLTASTRPGAILGTPAYMSPEQARGEAVDKRSDIWSFGCVLYECLTGTSLFKAETPIDSLHAVLHKEPDWTVLPSETPTRIQALLRRCLTRDRKKRLQDIREAWIEIDAAISEPVSTTRAPAGAGEAWTSDPKSKSVERPRRRFFPVALSALCVFIFAGATWLIRHRFTSSPESRVPSETKSPNQVAGAANEKSTAGARRIESVAVLPFKNFVTDTNKFYFADMLTEEIIAKLGEMSAIKNSALKRVPSAPTMMTYKGTTLSTRAIAQELNVDSLVAGSLTLMGTQATIRVQLIAAAQDASIWSTNYVGDVDHLVQLQNEMALEISRAIRLVLTPEEQSRLTSARQVDPRALEAYTRGKYCGGTDEDNLEAIKFFEEAVRIAPDFAAGHTALAGAYVWRYYKHVPQEHKQWEKKAFLALDTALRLDPDLADAHVTLGRALWTPFKNFQHEEAMIEFQHAAKLNPNSFQAHGGITTVYCHTGLLDEALVHSQREAELNRLSSRHLLPQAVIFLWKLEYEKSLRLWRKVSRDNMPSVVGSHTAWAQFGLGQTNAAAATIRAFLKEFPADKSGELTAMNAVLRAAAGDAAGANKEIQSATTKDTGYGEFHHTAYFIAAAYALMNLREEALSWVEKTADTGFPCYPLFVKDPNLNSLRGTPGFVSFLNNQKKQWQERKDTWLKTDDLVKASAAR